ncbi:hypothetical protein COL83_22320 [Bacillus wiedmannii]|nr:hypothetical protein COL83_22320 [Bacillus wiedmannii]
MISPSFSPPFCKFRNIFKNTIKYTNFDYSKLKKMNFVSFKRKDEKMKRPFKPSTLRGFMNTKKK